jgi:hypothetical protein
MAQHLITILTLNEYLFLSGFNLVLYPKRLRINIPTLFVHSEEAAIPAGAKKFFKSISGKKASFGLRGHNLIFTIKKS